MNEEDTEQFCSNGQGRSRQIGDLPDSFGCHFFLLAMATKTVSAWSAACQLCFWAPAMRCQTTILVL